MMQYVNIKTLYFWKLGLSHWNGPIRTTPSSPAPLGCVLFSVL